MSETPCPWDYADQVAALRALPYRHAMATLRRWLNTGGQIGHYRFCLLRQVIEQR